MAYKSAQPHFTQSFEDDGETPMFVVERNDDYKIRKAQYSIKMSESLCSHPKLVMPLFNFIFLSVNFKLFTKDFKNF